jgi:TFIIF-interacting CTD phosphatase-like protein
MKADVSETMVEVKRLLVILDLDETLIHGSTSIAKETADFQSGPHRCLIRPHALDLIDALLDRFEVAVWTSAGELHAQSVVDALFESRDDLSFVWSASRCTDYRDFENDRTVSLKQSKKLRRYGYELDHVIAIDESPENICAITETSFVSNHGSETQAMINLHIWRNMFRG